MTKDRIKNRISAAYNAVKQPSFITGVFIALSMSAIYFGALFLRTYEVTTTDGTLTIHGFEQDAYEALENNGIAYKGRNYVNISYINHVECAVDVLQGHKISVFADGEVYTAYTLGTTLSELLENMGLKLGPYDTVSLPLNTYFDRSEVVQLSRIFVQTVTREEVIPSPVTDRSNPNSSIEPITIAGRDGLRRVTVFEKYKNGRLIESTVLEEEIIKQASDTLIYTPVRLGDNNEPRPAVYIEELIVEATAYTATGNRTATGRQAQVGYVAVDPNYIPLGTRMYIESLDGSWAYGYAEAQDTGGAVKGYIIDLYMNTYEECIRFGRRDLRVYILP